MAFLHFLELQLTTERENIGETGKENVRECLGEDVRGREGVVGQGERRMGEHVRCAGVRGTTSKSPENLRFGSVSTI